ncbi:phage integrase N-terminal SAM-like domain-containing protein [Paraburkholderia sp. HD33-4]|uniref:phage integrase N-terminal SAM-like domain-containing protein n=1 Tax=Paraburkholderia sp. HD33-4 TaxID=2883242 RepID=UPI003FA38783
MRRSASFSSAQPTVGPLRLRMIEDMRMRQLSPRTQANYPRIVREFTRYLGCSPDTATIEGPANLLVR